MVQRNVTSVVRRGGLPARTGVVSAQSNNQQLLFQLREDTLERKTDYAIDAAREDGPAQLRRRNSRRWPRYFCHGSNT